MATRKKAKGKAKAKPRKMVAGKPAALKQAAKARKKPPPKKKAPARRASPVKAKPAAKPTPARTPAAPATGKPAGPVHPAAAWKPTAAGAPSQPAGAAKPAPAGTPAEPGERVGVVTHYYNHLGVAVVRLESGTLRVGDTICIRGHTTDFTQRVASLQVEHAPVTEVGPNDDFALKVVAHAREHDVVYKVRP